MQMKKETKKGPNDIAIERLGIISAVITVMMLAIVAITERVIIASWIVIIPFFVSVYIVFCILYFSVRWFYRRLIGEKRAFLKEYRAQLSSEDPKVLSEISEKCDEYLKNRKGTDIQQLSKQAKTKALRIQKQLGVQATFKSKISEDGSHPRVISTFKQHMHNPDSFQHVSSEYEETEKDGKYYHKITMTCRGTNTFGALVLQTYFFLLDENNQISLVGAPDKTESSIVKAENYQRPS